jgi:hypothetical protein
MMVIAYDRGKINITRKWTHIWANLKDKRKTKNKRIFLSGAVIVLI